MNLFNPSEVTANYAMAGRGKVSSPAARLFLLGILAGALVAFAGAASNTAVHAIENAGLAKLIAGLIFPFGLPVIIVTGAELFTGNCLLTIPLLRREVRVGGVLRNLSLVYGGNLLGAVCVAACCVYSGQINCGGGALALYTIKVAAMKCALPFTRALLLGICCNVLVTLGVLMSLCAKDVAGRVMGAFLPVAIFVICGFEHSVANMFYIPAGLFALSSPELATAAMQAGTDISKLSVGGFLVGNLIPVTIGNMIGGAAVGALFHCCWPVSVKKQEATIQTGDAK